MDIKKLTDPFLYLLIIYFLLQLRTIQVLGTNPKYRSSTCFRIIFCIAVLDAIYLLSLIVAVGIGTVKWSHQSLLNAICQTLFFLQVMVAINRLCVFIKLYVLSDLAVWTVDQRWQQRVHWFCTVVIVLIFVANALLFDVLFVRSLTIGVLYDRLLMGLYVITFSARNISPWVTLACYLLIFAIMKRAKGKFENGIHDSIEATQKRGESRVMIQCFLQFAVYMWQPLGSFVPEDSLVEFRSFMSYSVFGISPIILLISLPDFRQQFVPNLVFSICRRLFHRNTISPNSKVIDVIPVQLQQSTSINTSKMAKIGCR